MRFWPPEFWPAQFWPTGFWPGFGDAAAYAASPRVVSPLRPVRSIRPRRHTVVPLADERRIVPKAV